MKKLSKGPNYMAEPIIELQNALIHKMIARMVMSYVAPVVIGLAPGPGADGEQTQNGSAALLEIGPRRFVITNDHVISAYEALGKHHRARFQVGDAAPFVPQIVDRDAHLDLAVIAADHLEASDVAEHGGDIQFWPIRPTIWPPAPVNRGDTICFGGWPQQYRVGENGDRVLTTGSWSLSAADVTEITKDGFLCVFDRTNWRDDIGRFEGGGETKNLGGLSGCPAFAIRGLSFEYVGVLFEYSPEYDTMFFRSTRLIRDDGTLARPL